MPASQRSGSAAFCLQNVPTSGCGRIRNRSSAIPASTASATRSGVMISPDAATACAPGSPSASGSISSGVATPSGQTTLTPMPWSP